MLGRGSLKDSWCWSATQTSGWMGPAASRLATLNKQLFWPDWKSNCYQTHSCPRDWRLSASCGTNWEPPKPPYINHRHSTIVLRGLRVTLNWNPIMAREASFGSFFQSGILSYICRSIYNKLTIRLPSMCGVEDVG